VTHPVLELRSVSKCYGADEARLQVLADIELLVREGEFLAITGPSGSGKSTLLNIIGCLDRPSAGSYLLDGEDVAGLSDNRLSTIRNERIGFIFQSFNLIPQLTVLENVEVPLYYRRHTGRGERECRELLKTLGMGDRLEHRPAQLSGGERQRVAIARALVNDPVLLLADEPTGNLDSQTGAEVLALIDRIHDEGRTVVMITHDAAIAERAPRRIGLMDGRIKSDA